MDRFTCEVAALVKKVTKTYVSGEETVYALKDIYFDAVVGEMEMIVGRSGSGKTSLLSVLAGTLKPDSGTIEIFGQTITDMDDSTLTNFRRENIGFIFQNNYLINELTNLENVTIPLLLNGFSEFYARHEAENLLEKMGIAHKKNSFPYELSGGQQQRVAIARALIHEPKMIICDEPTASLDAEMATRVMELMNEMVRSPGRSVVIVTHDNRIFKYADRLFYLEDGRIVNYDENDSDIFER
jgi:putative ABC transport system ATP-binding protein